jgi:hypothetical protein
MNIVAGIKNWVSFRSMITPIILKGTYHLCFIVLNVVGVLCLIGMPLMMILGGLAAQDNNGLVMAIVMAIIFFIIGAILLVIYNILLRVYFELILLLFNMYDELKAINSNTKNSYDELKVINANTKK